MSSRSNGIRLFNFEHDDILSWYYKIHCSTIYEPFFDTKHLRLLRIEYILSWVAHWPSVVF